MGLLDEAIREHLELKRRRGGDPSGMAREEREALTARPRGRADRRRRTAADEKPLGSEIAYPSAPAPTAAGASAQDQQDRVPGLAAGSQETAELDMQAAMADDPDAADPAAPEAPFVDEQAFAGDGNEAGDDAALEWEVPTERDRARCRRTSPAKSGCRSSSGPAARSPAPSILDTTPPIARVPIARELRSALKQRPSRDVGHPSVGSRLNGRSARQGRILNAPGAIAQLGERLLCKQEVTGSIPVGSIPETPKSPDSNRPCKVGGFRCGWEAGGMQTKHRRREGQPPGRAVTSGRRSPPLPR